MQMAPRVLTPVRRHIPASQPAHTRAGGNAQATGADGTGQGKAEATGGQRAAGMTTMCSGPSPPATCIALFVLLRDRQTAGGRQLFVSLFFLLVPFLEHLPARALVCIPGWRVPALVAVGSVCTWDGEGRD